MLCVAEECPQIISCKRKKGRERETDNIIWSEDRVREIIAIEGDPEERCFREQCLVGADIVVNSVFAFKMWDDVFSVAQFLAVGKGAPDVVLKGVGLGGSPGHVDALLHFNFNSLFWTVSNERLEEISDGEDGAGALVGEVSQ